VEGPAGVATLLMGVQVGLYGIVRFAVPLAPQAAWQWHGLLIGLGALTALYGGLLALKQSSLPRLLAFSSISQAGLALVGVATFTFQGIQGALLQLCNIGILAGGFFLLLSFLRHNVGATDLDALAAAPRHMPLFTSVLLMLVLAGVGLPGSQGFIAWHLLVVGAFKSHVGAGLAVLAVAVLGTAYFFRLFRAACDGPLAPDAAQAIDLKPREVYAASVFVVLALIFGLFPQILLHLTQKPLGNWIARLQSGYVSTLASIAEEPPRRASPAEVGKSVVP
jgi:NADH-quinone oxidoreductase subunit M